MHCVSKGYIIGTKCLYTEILNHPEITAYFPCNINMIHYRLYPILRQCIKVEYVLNIPNFIARIIHSLSPQPISFWYISLYLFICKVYAT